MIVAGIWQASVLFAAGFLLYGCNNAFMVLSPVLVLDLGGSVVEAGVQGTAFVAAAVGLRFLFGPLSDRRGLKPVMLSGALAYVVTGPLLALCAEFWQVLLVRCAQAAGLAAYFPAATAAVVAAAPAGRAGSMLGLYRLVSSASLMVAPAAAFFVVDASGFGTCLTLLGGCAAVAFGLVLAVRIPGGAGAPAAGGGARRLFVGDAPAMAPVLGATLLAALGYGLLGTYAAPFIEASLPGAPTGMLFTFVGAGGVVSNPLVGWASDRMRQGRLFAALLVCLGAGLVLLAAAPRGFELTLCAGFLVGFGYFGSMTCVLSIVAARVAEERRVSALALQQNGIDVGIACAGAAFGLAVEAAGSAAVFAAWGAATVACAMVAVAWRAVRSGGKGRP